jgi:serine protease inhibitor
LTRLGFTEIFDSSVADFTNMVSPQPNSQGVYVSDARHKTYVEVNEDGSEAAASTTIVLCSRCGILLPIYTYVVLLNTNNQQLAISSTMPCYEEFKDTKGVIRIRKSKEKLNIE